MQIVYCGHTLVATLFMRLPFKAWGQIQLTQRVGETIII